jgi:cobalt-zinc-cadmium efflux system outer membrane protein
MVFILLLLPLSLTVFAETLSPVEALKLAYNANPELATAKARSKAEEEAISSKYSLASPRIGFRRETDMNFMQMQNGPMTTLSISQGLEFPTKYFTRGRMQKAVAQRMSHDLMETQLEVRSKALSNYFRCYSTKQILDLLKAQKETLREIARIAEARRAAGSAPQQDEMKAHVEQTMIENEILLVAQEYAEAKFALNAVLNRPIESEIDLSAQDYIVSEDIKLEENIDQVSVEFSHHLKGEQFLVEEAGFQRSLAKWNYYPDFELMYSRTIDYDATGYAFGIQLTIPLWFWTKESSELASAVSKEVAAKRSFTAHRNMIEAKIKSLKVKVQTLAKQLEIYKTALIPQATSSLNSSRSAYSTGRVGFQELLDAERTLYSIRIQYYENFSKFINAITELERASGRKVSSLPFLVEDH